MLVNSLNQTARRNIDFLLPSDGLVVEFEDGQTVAEASVHIIDDEEMEEAETFTLAITNPEGGVELGDRLLTEVCFHIMAQIMIGAV